MKSFSPRGPSRWIALIVIAGAVGMSDSRATAPAGRYTYPDGNETSSATVHDTVTGLTWQRNAAPATMNWDDANTYCTTTTFGLVTTGWRLPGVKELTSIVDFSISGPSIDSVAFPGTATNEPDYWTSALSHIPGELNYWWAVTFADGTPIAVAPLNLLNVRCVSPN